MDVIYCYNGRMSLGSNGVEAVKGDSFKQPREKRERNGLLCIRECYGMTNEDMNRIQSFWIWKDV